MHPNTLRAWSDQGRVPFYRINARGDRRYRLGDLQRFLADAQTRPEPTRGRRGFAGTLSRPVAPSIGAEVVERRTRPLDQRWVDLSGATRGTPSSRVIYRAPVRTRLDVAILAHLADLVGTDADLDVVLNAAVDDLHDRAGHDLVAILERREGWLVTRAGRGVAVDRLGSIEDSAGLPSRALKADGPVAEAEPADPDWLGGSGSLLRNRVAAAIRDGGGAPWGVVIVGDEGGLITQELAMFVSAVARSLGVAVHAARLRSEWVSRLHRAESVRRIAVDIAGKEGLDEILDAVVDHVRVLFGAQRAAASIRATEGRISAEASRGFSAAFLAALRDQPRPSLQADAAETLHPVVAVRFADDPRSRPVRAAVVQEGVESLCVAPICAGTEVLGLLMVGHDRAHAWGPDELAILGALAAHLATTVTSARNLARMSTWAAQLQSIQQLGVRLSRLTTEREIGEAISNELETLIAFHNVRVYRLREEGWLVPVAMRGLVGEFRDETPDLLRMRIGDGITGWVARHNLAQKLGDAAHDPRALTIAGTDDDLDESMLLAPMTYEAEVLGVIVLSKLGLHQFSDDDLRLLVIYASLAAQAMANAETSEHLWAQTAQLERRLASQRALLAITETILGTFDTRAILEQVVDRLSAVVRLDTISIELVEPETGILRPILARGVHAADYLEPWESGEEGLATWVIAHGEPQLVVDELQDSRVRQFATTGPLEGSLICVPLRGPDGALGVVSLERLGAEDRFNDDDFELVQLFAGQVSIALRNAAAFRVKEIEAQTDEVTGLLNAGTFRRWLAEPARPEDHFGLLMLDLDNFKDVNETMGHEAGTELLRQIARTIADASRDSDRVFRYGGDEFAVLVATPDPAGAMAVARRIRAALRSLAGGGNAQGGRPNVSASIGVATFPADGATNADLLLAADRACFVAKRRGRDTIATAAEGLAHAADFTLSEPTPMDPVAPSAS